MSEVTANGWDEPAPAAPVSQLPRAPIVDIAEGPCDICAAWEANKYHKDPEDERRVSYACDECGQIIPDIGLMRGRGFNSLSPHHYHLRPIKDVGVPAKAAVNSELCPDCYRKHRAKVYPFESAERRELYLNPNGLPNMAKVTC